MEILTCIHVYSVQLALPHSSVGLWQVDSEWHKEDYQHKSGTTPLSDNRCGFTAARDGRLELNALHRD